ncbi:nitronate monooxygenase [Streptomyces sp. BE147]|nr:nitronate monooxygenase [Streptomyces sp. BE147]
MVDLAGPVPVLAAGGIADGRGVATALVLGAAGALIGTRFPATTESLASPSITASIIAGRGQDTEPSTVLPIARGASWPSRYPARTLGHPCLDRRRGRETELAADPGARQAYEDSVARGAVPPQPAWAGEAVDLITDPPSAETVVTTMATHAQEALARAGRDLTHPARRCRVRGASRTRTRGPEASVSVARRGLLALRARLGTASDRRRHWIPATGWTMTLR